MKHLGGPRKGLLLRIQVKGRCLPFLPFDGKARKLGTSFNHHSFSLTSSMVFFFLEGRGLFFSAEDKQSSKESKMVF